MFVAEIASLFERKSNFSWPEVCEDSIRRVITQGPVFEDRDVPPPQFRHLSRGSHLSQTVQILSTSSRFERDFLEASTMSLRAPPSCPVGKRAWTRGVIARSFAFSGLPILPPT